MLTQERLKELLYYHPSSGDFVWLQNRKFASAGEQAGNPDKDGYKVLWIDNRPYRCGRLAWFYMTGTWPTNEVDHENLNRSDDSWENLRDGTRSQNCKNKKVQSNNRTGFKGVGWHKSSQQFRARINGQHLGSFGTAAEAHAAYVAAASKLNGEFAHG